MATVEIPLRASTKPGNHADILRFLRSEIRRRRRGRGGLALLAGTGADGFEASYYVPVTRGEVAVTIQLRLLGSSELKEVRIEASEPDGVLSEDDLKGEVQGILLAAIDRYSADDTEKRWVRSYAAYPGLPLAGWYDFGDWRVAPVRGIWENAEDEEQRKVRAILQVDVEVDSVDRIDALETAVERETQVLAWLTFFLSRPVERLDSGQHVLVAGPDNSPVLARRWVPAARKTVECDSSPFNEPTARGEWGEDLLFPWREPGQQKPTRNTIAVSALRFQRRAQPKQLEAFDTFARVNHVAALVPKGFRAAALALRVAAVEALAQNLPRYAGTSGDKQRFLEFMSQYSPLMEKESDRLYGRWRSGVFHSGEFASIDRGYPHIDLAGISAEMDYLNRSGEFLRRSVVHWVESIAGG